MSEKQTGGPAFPHHVVCDKGWAETQKLQGMTLRDYFAAEAMPEMTWEDKAGSARECYEIADEMLKAREQ